MGGGKAAGWKVMGVLLMAMLPGVVEAGNLVWDECRPFGNYLLGLKEQFEYGCGFGCGWNDGSQGDCTDGPERTPAECKTRCVRHHPHLLLAPPASPTAALRVRFTTWCCTRSFVC